MDPAQSAELVKNRGLVGNADQGRKRQVTIIEKEVWTELMNTLGVEIDPSARRANLMVSNLNLAASRKKTLQIGNCRIKIYNETKPCERMDEVAQGLQELMRNHWKGGAFGTVLDSGLIRVGDPVSWLDE